MVRAQTDDFGLTEFLKIGPDELNAKGKLRPVGARHFSRKAQIMQNLLGLITSGIMNDPGVSVHISGKKIAELAEEMLGLGKFDIVADNIRIVEQMETQSAQTMAQQQVAEEVQGRQQVVNQQLAQEEATMMEDL